MAIVVLPHELVFKKYTLTAGQITEGYTFEDWYFKSEDGVETLQYKDLVIRREACLQDVIFIPKRIRGKAAYLLKWAKRKQGAILQNTELPFHVRGRGAEGAERSSGQWDCHRGGEVTDRPEPDSGSMRPEPRGCREGPQDTQGDDVC